VLEAIKKIFKYRRKVPSLDPEAEEKARNLFQTRYHAFKLLLAANNRSLEAMSEMEKAMQAKEPFSMAFVRSRCTSVSTNVYSIIDNLLKLAPGKYQNLPSVYREICKRIQDDLAPENVDTSGPVMLEIKDIDKDFSNIVGPKMANLGEMRNKLGLCVPDGFVLTRSAYYRFIRENDLQTEIDRRIQATRINRIDQLFDLCSGLQTMITRAAVPEEIIDALKTGYDRVAEKSGRENLRLSLRSSALGEDLARASFAGQYRSVLNVDKENLEQVYKLILASKYSPQAVSYRFYMGLKDEEVAMCVACMPMVPARKSGVIYSRNPLDLNDDKIRISSTWGLAKAIVDGGVDPDQFIVSRSKGMSIIKKEIGEKNTGYYCCETEGLSRKQIPPEMRKESSLTDQEILKLARTAQRLEEHYAAPQDIEWSMDNGDLWILQSRPLAQNSPPERKTGEEDSAPVQEPLFSEGITAAPGISKGKVFKVEKDADLVRFPRNSILVSRQSSPKWASVLPRSAGVITEHGSITGHLANVAREFGIPALFGVGDAFSRLENKQLLTMDADKQRIYAGEIPQILEKNKQPTSLILNSPVHETLKKVASHITPLNLLDPDSLDFKPANCRTLHDITRFAHEKSVQEMFNFGKNQSFAPMTGKQLKTSVAMQWWVLDIEDGFKNPVSGKTVGLDNIQSIPMLAIWEGIVAVPWEGPPRMDKSGFMSVLLQATTNPNLEPSLSTDYALKNYFMISRNFCHLQSRFGFHFTEVEALVGERTPENYARFQFKGGAADLPRRKMRAEFIAEILRKFAFACDVKEDALFARIDDLEKEFMSNRLRIVGYMLMHTRQLDMVMSNTGSRDYYREKIEKDIREGLGIEN